jgi:hypothetical protein
VLIILDQVPRSFPPTLMWTIFLGTGQSEDRVQPVNSCLVPS